jgi:hypothetical protein
VVKAAVWLAEALPNAAMLSLLWIRLAAEVLPGAAHRISSCGGASNWRAGKYRNSLHMAAEGAKKWRLLWWPGRSEVTYAVFHSRLGHASLTYLHLTRMWTSTLTKRVMTGISHVAMVE